MIKLPAGIPDVKGFLDAESNTISYVVSDPHTSNATVIDPVLAFDPVSGRTDTASVEKLVDYANSNGLHVKWILETHAHADHLSAAPFVRKELGGRIGMGKGIREVERHFGTLFNQKPSMTQRVDPFDHLFEDGEEFCLGDTKFSPGDTRIRVMNTPGHTPSCVTYLIGDCAFVGDTLFMPDGGTARADFPGGDARTLYASIGKILQLPAHTRVFVCHDYGPGGRDIAWETTVGEERQLNIHVGKNTSESDFIKLRDERDRSLSLPKLIVPAIQVNIQGGKLPPPEDNGIAYVKIPINVL